MYEVTSSYPSLHFSGNLITAWRDGPRGFTEDNIGTRGTSCGNGKQNGFSFSVLIGISFMIVGLRHEVQDQLQVHAAICSMAPTLLVKIGLGGWLQARFVIMYTWLKPASRYYKPDIRNSIFK